MCSGVSASGDLPKWRANSETCWRYDACVWGDRLRTCISCVIRCRRTVMGEAPLRYGSAATSSASMMSQSDLSKMHYDGSAPTIATRQLPRSGFVQFQMRGAGALPRRGSDGVIASVQPDEPGAAFRAVP